MNEGDDNLTLEFKALIDEDLYNINWSCLRYVPNERKVNAYDLLRQLNIIDEYVNETWIQICEWNNDLKQNVDYYAFKTSKDDQIFPVLSPSQALTIISYLTDRDSFRHFAIINHLGTIK